MCIHRVESFRHCTTETSSIPKQLYLNKKNENKYKTTEMRASQVPLVVKNPLANAGDIRDAGLIPGPGRSPGEGNGNSLQYSCLEHPMNRIAWWATVHGVAKSRHN